MNTAARRCAAVAAATIAALAMLVSFRALTDLAERWHALPPGLGWTLPAMIDGLAVAGGVAALARRFDGHRALYPWTVVLLGAGASLAGNVSHAPAATGARIVAAAPPLVATLALHLAMEEARRRNRTTPASGAAAVIEQDIMPGRADVRPAPTPRIARGTPAPDVRPAETPTLSTGPAAPNADPPVKRARRASASAAMPARDRARAFLADRAPGKPVTGAVLGEAIGCSPEHARRVLRQLELEEPITNPSTNGYARTPA